MVVGTNSWITLVEANAYFLYKYGAIAGWSVLSDSDKESLLISSYRWIINNPNYTIPSAATEQNIKDAQCEGGWFIYKYWTGYVKRESLIAGGVKSFRLSKFSETFGEQSLPQSIKNLLEGDMNSSFSVVTRDLD